MAMTDARVQDNWSHTSALLALIANVNRDPRKTRAMKPADFNPYSKSASDGTKPMADIRMLKDVFVRPAKKERT